MYCHTYCIRKSFPHTPSGYLEPAAFRGDADALLSHNMSFPRLGPPRRPASRGPGDKGGDRRPRIPFVSHLYHPERADAASLTIPPAPVLASDESAAETAEWSMRAVLRLGTFKKLAAGGDQATKLANALMVVGPYSSLCCHSIAHFTLSSWVRYVS